MCVCVDVVESEAGADSGEHGRRLIAAPTSVLERRCQKFPGGLRTPAPAFHLPFFVFPSLPTSLPSLPPFFLLFSPRSEWSAVALLTLIPRSSLLTFPSHCVCACARPCVFVMRRGKISLQQYEASKTRIHSQTN